MHYVYIYIYIHIYIYVHIYIYIYVYIYIYIYIYDPGGDLKELESLPGPRPVSTSSTAVVAGSTYIQGTTCLILLA